MDEPFEFGSESDEPGDEFEKPESARVVFDADSGDDDLEREIGIDEIVNVLMAERDEYLKALQLTKADFDNYRRRTLRMESESADRRLAVLLERLLPSLDDLNSLYVHKLGTEDEDLVSKTVLPVFTVLAGEGLERFDDIGVAFDPSVHQAVAHEDGEGPPTVAEVFRAGYVWKGKTLRPAMVKVVG